MLVRVLALGACLTMTVPSLVHATEEAGGSHGEASEHSAEHHVPSVGDLLLPTINFALYFFIVVWFIIPAMREYLRRRHDDVVEAATTSRNALTRAEETMAASKKRLAALQSEADAIRQDLVAIANRHAERVVAQAEETGKRRVADAALVAEQERRRALSEIRVEVADAAATLAERRVRGALTADDQRAFVQQFLKDAHR
jgi:F-type H+-transporting ATPase subunit b